MILWEWRIFYDNEDDDSDVDVTEDDNWYEELKGSSDSVFYSSLTNHHQPIILDESLLLIRHDPSPKINKENEVVVTNKQKETNTDDNK